MNTELHLTIADEKQILDMFTGNASTPIFLKGTSNLDYVTCICALHVYAWACRMPVHIHVVPHTQVDEGGNIIK